MYGYFASELQFYVFEGFQRFSQFHRVPSSTVRPLLKIKMARPNDAAFAAGAWDHDRTADVNSMSDKSDKLEDPKLGDYDVEGQGRRRSSHHHVAAVDSSSMSESERIGRQIEMESENTIKYRTCSWQKVGFWAPVHVGWN